MNKKLLNKKLFIIFASCSIALGSACASNESATTNRTSPATANHAHADNTASSQATHSSSITTDDVPAAVRAALPEAQTITTHHKDLPAATVAEIEKQSGAKILDRDHHAYLAFSNDGGARRQIGAATVVKVEGTEIVIVYDSRAGMPIIREARSPALPAAFLASFKGKNHDDALTAGKDIIAGDGISQATAQAVTAAIKADVLTMQALYGAPHTH